MNDRDDMREMLHKIHVNDMPHNIDTNLCMTQGSLQERIAKYFIFRFLRRPL